MSNNNTLFSICSSAFEMPMLLAGAFAMHTLSSLFDLCIINAHTKCSRIANAAEQG